MKAIFTLLLILFFGLIATAQNTDNNDTVESIEMGVVLDSGSYNSKDLKEIQITAPEKSVVRLYKFKNSRVKKALAFTTKKDKPKLA